MKALLYIALSTLVVVTACKKDEDEDHEDPVTATFDITTLHEGDSIANGSMAMVHGTITGSGEMHGYKVQFITTSSGNVEHENSLDSHASSYSLMEEWTNNVSTTSNMKVVITAYIDHDGGTQTKEINFVAKGQ